MVLFLIFKIKVKYQLSHVFKDISFGHNMYTVRQYKLPHEQSMDAHSFTLFRQQGMCL